MATPTEQFNFGIVRDQAAADKMAHIMGETSDRNNVTSSRQTEANAYLKDYNQMLTDGHLPKVHINETVTAADGDKTISAHYNAQGKIDHINEHDTQGHEGSYDINEQGQVTQSTATQRKIEHGMGYKFDDGPIITVKKDELDRRGSASP